MMCDRGISDEKGIFVYEEVCMKIMKISVISLA